MTSLLPLAVAILLLGPVAPIMVGRFSFSSSSSAVSGSTSGSGCHSSTSSSISCNRRQHSDNAPTLREAYIFRELDFVLVLGFVFRAQKVADRKKEEEEFNCASYRVILVTAPNVS